MPAKFYLPSVAEVYNIHVGLSDVPLQVLWAVLLLKVNGEDQLLFLTVGLQHSKHLLALRFKHKHTTEGQAFTEPQQTDNKSPRHSRLPLIFITHMRDADSPATDTPHLIRQLEFHHVLLDACQVVLQIAVLLKRIRHVFLYFPLKFNLSSYLQQTHPVRVLLAVNGALPAADVLVVGRVSLDRHDPQHQLVLQLLHLLLLGLFGLHLVHKL